MTVRSSPEQPVQYDGDLMSSADALRCQVEPRALLIAGALQFLKHTSRPRDAGTASTGFPANVRSCR